MYKTIKLKFTFFMLNVSSYIKKIINLLLTFYHRETYILTVPTNRLCYHLCKGYGSTYTFFIYRIIVF